MTNDPLYVITCVSNPVRYQTRYDLYGHFAKRVADAGAILYTTEMAFGGRPFAITDANCERHIQVRSTSELWHKENMLNLALQRLPSDWKYVAWIDADVMFARPDWVRETIEQLQHYSIVQMFSQAQDLSPRFETINKHQGFVHYWYHEPDAFYERTAYSKGGHPGYAWAARREMLDAVGGLMDFCLLGAGDRHMACSLIGKVDYAYHADMHPNYHRLCLNWQERAERAVKRNVGYVPGMISHFWHGSKANRGYKDRWKILTRHQFDPTSHACKDTQGLWQLNDDPALRDLRDDIRRYFRSRQEDCIYTGEYKLLP